MQFHPLSVLTSSRINQEPGPWNLTGAKKNSITNWVLYRKILVRIWCDAAKLNVTSEEWGSASKSVKLENPNVRSLWQMSYLNFHVL